MQTNVSTNNVEHGNAETKSTTASKPNGATRLVDFVVKNENDALNGLVSFINLAQRRGAFSVDEAAKIWECISIFNRTEVSASSPEATDILPDSDMDSQYNASV